MSEPPYDCDLCRIEVANRLLDCVPGDITASVATFVVSINTLATTFDTDIISVVRYVMIDLHDSHGGYSEA